MNTNSTFEAALSRWQTVHALGRKPTTVRFNTEVAGIIRAHWPNLTVPAESITADMVLAFAQTVSGYCPSRWNAIVSAFRSITPHGTLLPRRRACLRRFSPPSQAQFAALLAECDAAPRSRAGLVVRFLAYTGLRISEARALTWLNVFADRIEVPGEVTKSGKGRAVPLLPGIGETLERLRALDSGGHVLPRQNARKAIERASLRAVGAAWSFHCFRHLFATRCIESLVDMPTVARWLGHQDGGALLARTYFHLVDEHSRAMAAKVQF